MQLSPNSLIPVSYTASIPGDTTVYFVQAVLRDTQSGTTLQTLNLTNVSTTPNRYQGSFNPVSDPSGLGRAIDITISVYTDSGHTTLSNNYQILQLNYTILQPWIQNLGTGGGLNIDYDKLQKMFDGTKVTNAEIGNEKAPKRERINYTRLEGATMGAGEATRAAISDEFKGHISNVLKILSDLSRSHSETTKGNSIKFDSMEKRLEKFESIASEGYKMSSKERAEMRTDMVETLKEIREENKNYLDEGSKMYEKKFSKIVEDMQEYLADNLSQKEIKMVYNMAPQKNEKEKKAQGFSPQDIQSLMRG